MPINTSSISSANSTINCNFSSGGIIVIAIVVAIVVAIIIIQTSSKGKPNQEEQEPKEGNSTNTENKELDLHEQKSKDSLAPVIITICIIILAVMGLLVCLSSIQNTESCNCDNAVIGVVKEKPSISCSQTLSGVNFDIFAKDDYNMVKISYSLKNGNNIIKSGDFTLYGLKKGKTYTKSFSFSFSEMVNVRSVEYRIIKYS